MRKFLIFFAVIGLCNCVPLEEKERKLNELKVGNDYQRFFQSLCKEELKIAEIKTEQEEKLNSYILSYTPKLMAYRKNADNLSLKEIQVGHRLKKNLDLDFKRFVSLKREIETSLSISRLYIDFLRLDKDYQ